LLFKTERKFISEGLIRIISHRGGQPIVETPLSVANHHRSAIDFNNTNSRLMI